MSPTAPSPTLLLPPRDPLPPATPSGLTPHTRSEAEAAFTQNTASQTDSAAPTTPLPPSASFAPTAPHTSRRGNNPALIRASSTNYETALRVAHAQTSSASESSPPAEKLASLDLNAAYPFPFPAPGEGVVPRYPEAGVGGVAAGQAEVVRKAKPLHLELGLLGRKQSWSAQDFRHVMQGMSLAGEESDDGDGGVGVGGGKAGVAV